MRRLLVLVMIATVLAACATPAERAARREREMVEMMTVYGPACEKLGYARDTDPWRDCILRLNERDTYERYARPPAAWSSCWGPRGYYPCAWW